jgi:hypothetical protein
MTSGINSFAILIFESHAFVGNGRTAICHLAISAETTSQDKKGESTLTSGRKSAMARKQYPQRIFFLQSSFVLQVLRHPRLICERA